MTWRVYDYFCGIGGYTAGAIAALGEAVYEGVDAEKDVLGLFGDNVRSHAPTGTTCTTRLAEIGRDVLEMPKEDDRLICHFSPPCTAFSTARRASPPTPEELEEAVRLVRWSMDAVVHEGYARWSLENVPTDAVTCILREYKNAHPSRIDFGTFDANLYGCASDRRRLIAGPPALIRRLGELAVPKVGVRDAFEAAGWALPSDFISNGNKNGGKLKQRGVNESAHTVTASHSLVFCDGAGRPVRCTKPAESAVLVGFPTSWRLPQGSKAAQRAAGNAISPCLSKVIVRVLLETPIGPTPLPSTSGGDGGSRTELEELRATCAKMRAELDELRPDVQGLWAEMRAQKRKLDALCASGAIWKSPGSTLLKRKLSQ